MTELRKRMIEGLQLRGLSERTQQMYVRAASFPWPSAPIESSSGTLAR
jgi:hypothetical protein